MVFQSFDIFSCLMKVILETRRVHLIWYLHFYSGTPLSYSGAHVSYSGAPVSYYGAPVSYNGAPVSYNGAPVSYSGAPVSYSAANCQLFWSTCQVFFIQYFEEHCFSFCAFSFGHCIVFNLRRSITQCLIYHCV